VTLLANIEIGWKRFPGTNVLIYLASLLVIKEKCLMILTTCVDVASLFSFVTDTEEMKVSAYKQCKLFYN